MQAIQGPGEMASPEPFQLPEIQDVENMTSSESLRVATDGAAKGGKLAGRQRTHRGDIGSFFPSGLMEAAEGHPEGGYVRLLRRGSMEKDSKMSC